MSTEDRWTHLEDYVPNHDATINLLTTLVERQQILLEEVRRDAQMTQRLWVRLAKKHGWLDDDDLTN